MRDNQPVAQHEIKFDHGTRLISTTDLKGRITHANDDFCRVAGFDREELLGQPHNIIRHPDMPPAVFQNFWDTLKAGKSWMGIVKNRSRNGDYYWVDAYVAPVFDGDTLVGYQSVRTVPDRAHVRRAERLYTRMRQRPGSKTRRLIPGLQGRTALLMTLLVALSTVIGALAGPGSATLLLGGLLAAACWPLSMLLFRRLSRVTAR
ncbi:MAG: PAS domain-containing protein, partial [Ectothiorhodospiraceae bacterium]|nr:PAS domain-containing protein [Ectothiorhodospiraceae bacterium]